MSKKLFKLLDRLVLTDFLVRIDDCCLLYRDHDSSICVHAFYAGVEKKKGTPTNQSDVSQR